MRLPSFFVASDTVNLSAPVSVEDGKASQRFIAKMQGKTKDAVIDYTIVQNGKAVSRPAGTGLTGHHSLLNFDNSPAF